MRMPQRLKPLPLKQTLLGACSNAWMYPMQLPKSHGLQKIRAILDLNSTRQPPTHLGHPLGWAVFVFNIGNCRNKAADDLWGLSQFLVKVGFGWEFSVQLEHFRPKLSFLCVGEWATLSHAPAIKIWCSTDQDGPGPNLALKVER